jgi:putative Ca2+/H+ antiporter (TMEM165/GDT1 family)
MNWKLFASTFALIFVGELPDKTAIAILLMAARHEPSAVFLGAAGAFVVQSLIAVIFGSLFSTVPARLVHIVSGILFLVFAIVMWRKKEESSPVTEETKSSWDGFWKSASTAFAVIFVAEWGDITQLATATIAAHEHAPVTIFTSATLALWTVTGLGAALGHGAKKSIHPEKLKKFAAAAFALVGLFLLIRS